jgi:UTP--glucose-1-phosphate uridylyltransferase
MQTFLSLYKRYLLEKTQPEKLCVVIRSFISIAGLRSSRDWKKVRPPGQAQIVDYNQLSSGNTSALGKLAVLKLNGGLGTSMGKLLSGPLTFF